MDAYLERLRTGVQLVDGTTRYVSTGNRTVSVSAEAGWRHHPRCQYQDSAQVLFVSRWHLVDRKLQEALHFAFLEADQPKSALYIAQRTGKRERRLLPRPTKPWCACQRRSGGW
eukprot:3258189-Rhodomonas_salina.2